MEIYTVGNGNRPFKKLLPILKEAQIDVIIDVRAIRNSWSGSYVGENLAKSLKPKLLKHLAHCPNKHPGICYYWFEGLGNHNAILARHLHFEKKALEEERLWQIEMYGERIRSGVLDHYVRAVLDLMDIYSKNTRFCLFCSEGRVLKKEKVNCHRYHIAERMVELMKENAVQLDVTHL